MSYPPEKTTSSVLQRAWSKVASFRPRISIRLFHPPRKQALDAWFRDQGDKTLRLDYDLTENAIVFDLGGYEGQWTSDIFSRYCCRVHVFEPVKAFAEQIQKRFARNGNIVVHDFGLADETKTVSIVLSKDRSSMFQQAEDSEQIRLVRAADFLNQRGIAEIHLMKINIEGGEYDLLDHLIECGFALHIQNIQVQFHDFVPDAVQRMVRIQKNLALTHALTYQYPFVWENWKRK